MPIVSHVISRAKILARNISMIGAATIACMLSVSAADLKELRAQLPGRILKDGISVAYSSYPPDNFRDANGKVVGWAIEILTETAKVLNIPINITEVTQFQSLLPGIDAERYDLAVSGFAVTEERKKRYDFVSYFNGGNSIIIHKDRQAITPEEMCGKKASIQIGSYFNQVVEKYSQKCASEGKSSIEILTFPTEEAVLGALTSKRADFAVSSLSSSAYMTTRTNGQFHSSGQPFFRTTAGFVFNKKNTSVRDAVAAAEQELLNNGTYAAILKKWNLSDGAIQKVEINP